MIRFKTDRFGCVNLHHSHTESPDASLFERHCHNGFELIYVIRGAGKYIVESAEYPLCPNTVLLLRPYEYHYVCPQSDTAYERCVIHFSEELLLEATRELSLIAPCVGDNAGIYFPSDAVPNTVRAQFESLDLPLFSEPQAVSDTPTRTETFLQTVVNQILLLLSYIPPDASRHTENELVGRIMQYLNEHLTEDLSLEDMSRCFFVSKYHLCHTFRAHTGVSIFSYLNTKRIALAQQMLEDGTPAVDAADRVGFGDYSVFYRAYRRLTGESPSLTKRKAKREQSPPGGAHRL